MQRNVHFTWLLWAGPSPGHMSSWANSFCGDPVYINNFSHPQVNVSADQPCSIMVKKHHASLREWLFTKLPSWNWADSMALVGLSASRHLANPLHRMGGTQRIIRENSKEKAGLPCLDSSAGPCWSQAPGIDLDSFPPISLFLKNLFILYWGMCVHVHSVMSNALWPYGLLSTRLLCPWIFPG